jgi:hypothetical protein
MGSANVICVRDPMVRVRIVSKTFGKFWITILKALFIAELRYPNMIFLILNTVSITNQKGNLAMSVSMTFILTIAVYTMPLVVFIFATGGI